MTRSRGTAAVLDEEFFTPDELSALIKISKNTLKSWRYNGEGPQWVNFGRRVRYEKAAVAAYIEANKQGAQ